jgi:hypothetical protein
MVQVLEEVAGERAAGKPGMPPQMADEVMHRASPYWIGSTIERKAAANPLSVNASIGPEQACGTRSTCVCGLYARFCLYTPRTRERGESLAPATQSSF